MSLLPIGRSVVVVVVKGVLIGEREEIEGDRLELDILLLLLEKRMIE